MSKYSSPRAKRPYILMVFYAACASPACTAPLAGGQCQGHIVFGPGAPPSASEADRRERHTFGDATAAGWHFIGRLGVERVVCYLLEPGPTGNTGSDTGNTHALHQRERWTHMAQWENKKRGE